MSKLSLRKNKPQSMNNPKITGFFVQKDKVKYDNECEDLHKNVLSNITNMLSPSNDKLLKSPESSKFNPNEIAATPVRSSTGPVLVVGDVPREPPPCRRTGGRAAVPT